MAARTNSPPTDRKARPMDGTKLILVEVPEVIDAVVRNQAGRNKDQPKMGGNK